MAYRRSLISLLISLSLMVCIELIVATSPAASAPTQPTQNVSGTIVTHTIWLSTTTYNVVNNVGVAPGITLTIQPGTVIKFNGNYSLTVGGTLIAAGTSAQPIRFMPNVTGTTWGRVYFVDQSVDAVTDVAGTYQSGNLLRWVSIEGAALGIGCTSATPYLSQVTVDGGGVNCAGGPTPIGLADSRVSGDSAFSTNPLIGSVNFAADYDLDIVVSGDYAYVADGANLRVISIADQAHPIVTATLTGSAVRSVAVQGQYAYVVDQYGGLYVVDISNPAQPVSVGNYDTPNSAYGVAVSGTYAYVSHDLGGGLYVINISNPTNPALVGVLTNTVRGTDVAVVGNTVYLAGYDDGLRVIDVADPAHPVEVGVCDTPGQAFGVEVVGRYAYVADRWGGLRVIDVQSAAHPVEIGFVAFAGDARDVVVSGNYAYLADYASYADIPRLRLFDLSAPAHPVQINGYSTSSVEDVAVADGLAYAVNSTGLRIVQLNPIDVRVLRTVITGNLNLPRASQVSDSSVNGPVAAGAFSAVETTTVQGSLSISGDGRVQHSSAEGITIDGAALAQQNNSVGGSLSVGNASEVLTNTVRGGGLVVGAGSVVQGNDVEDAPAWGVSSSGTITATGNRIVGAASGLQASGYLQGNLIANSAGPGIQASGQIVSNTIIGAAGDALVISATSIVRGNNLDLNSGPYDLVNTSSASIDAAQNWWGITDTSVIGPRLYDYYTDFNLGIVTYEPILTEPVSNAPAYVRSITLTPGSPIGLETAVFDVQFSRAMDYAQPPTITFYSTQKDTWQTFNATNSGLSDTYPIASIGVDASGTRWFGLGYGGVSVWRADGTWQTYNSANSGFMASSASAMAQDALGNWWIATEQGVIERLTDGAWQIYDTANSGLENNAVHAVTIGANGDRWFGTSGGVSVLRTNGVWQTYTTLNSGLANNFVTAISLDAAGNVWFSTNGGGVSVLRATGMWQTYTWDNSDLASDSVLASGIDATGALWFGTISGVNQLRDGRYWYTYWSNTVVRAIASDAAGDVWLATNAGVRVRHPDGSWHSYGTSNTSLAYDNVPAIAIDPVGNVWASTSDAMGGTSGGVSVRWSAPAYPVDGLWSAADVYRATYDFNTLLPRDTYTVSVAGAVGADQIVIAPRTDVTFTFDYTGTFDITPPPAPIVQACASALTTTLSVQWTTPTTLTLNLYRYAIGTAPAQTDVVDWTDTALNSLTRTDLDLDQGQTYYLAIKARSAAGIWGAVGASNGVVAGAGGCPQLDFTAMPTTGMSPLSVSFTSTITGAITLQTWSFGDGITTTDVAPVHTYGPGAYTITLDAIGPGGWSTLVRPAYINVAPDTLPPTGVITVAHGAEFSATPVITVEVAATDPSGVEAIRLSNEDLTYTAWVSYTTALSWTLSSGDGPKTVSAQLRDVPGNIATFTDIVTLDTTPPSAMVATLPTFTGSPTFTVTWSGTDAASGIDTFDLQMRVGASGTWSDLLTTPISQTPLVLPGLDAQTYFFRVRARDVLGNLGTYATGDGDTHTTIDLSPPIGQVAINGGAPYAGNVSVTLNLTATDLSGVEAFTLSTDGLSYTDWLSFTPAYSWTLPTGDGLKTVFVRYRDHVGHIADPVTDTITLYTQAPSGALNINAGAWATSSPSVTLTITATDGLGLVEMCVTNETAACSLWETFVTTRLWQLMSTDGVQTVTTYLRNQAGNITPISDDIVLDTTPPTVTLTLPPDYQTVPTFTVAWSGSDVTTGLAGYDVQWRNAAGDWHAWLTQTLSMTAAFNGADGHLYAFRARAADQVNNLSPWSDPITTTVDMTAPGSRVSALPAVEISTTFPITWTGFDATSGIAAYDLQVRDGLAGSWTTWLTHTTFTTTLFTGLPDRTYYFRSRAIDVAGNVEGWPADLNGDAVTLIKVNYHVYVPLVRR